MVINNFGKEGGFDFILKRLKDRENWAFIQEASQYMKILANFAMFLYEPFIKSYAPLTIEAAKENIFLSPEANVRNFKGKEMDFISTG